MYVRHTAVVALLVVAGAACGSSSSKANNSSPTTNSSSGAYGASSSTDAPTTTSGGTTGTGDAPVKVAKVGDDTLFVDSKGFTVYSFAPDSATSSACGTGCDKVWPPVTATGALPADVGGVKLTTLKRSDGTMQVVVNGHPVYTFSGDMKVGDAKGQGVLDKWYYVNEQGEPDKG